MAARKLYIHGESLHYHIKNEAELPEIELTASKIMRVAVFIKFLMIFLFIEVTTK